MSFEDRVLTPTPEGVTLNVELAGLGSRFGAIIVDSIVQIIVFIAMLYVGGKLLHGVFSSSADLEIGSLALLYFVVFFGYFILFEMLWSGQTIGKRLSGIRVVRANGSAIGFVPSVLRNFARLIDVLPTAYLVGAIAMLASTNNQRLGDMMANTVVVRERHGADSRKMRRQLAVNDFMVDDRRAADPLPAALSTWDVSAISDEEAFVIQRFLTNRATYAPAARARLAASLANRVRPRVAASSDDADAETFLQHVMEVRAARR